MNKKRNFKKIVGMLGILLFLAFVKAGFARFTENDPFFIPPTPGATQVEGVNPLDPEEAEDPSEEDPQDPIDETIQGALSPNSDDELEEYREEVNNYIEQYQGRDLQELSEDRDYWTGQLDWWRTHPYIDGFISGPERVEEAKLRLIALNKVMADKYAEMHGIKDSKAIEEIRQQLNTTSLKDSNGQFKQLVKTPEEAIEEKCKHYDYREAVKWLRYWQGQYNYWVNKANRDGVILNDGIFNAANQIDAAVLYIKALTKRINQIRQQYGVEPISAPNLKNTQQLGFSTDSFEAGKHHTPNRSLQEDLDYWYTQLHVNLGTREQTQARRDYARGVLYTEINYLLQHYQQEMVINYLMRLFRVSKEELSNLFNELGLNVTF